MRTQLKWLKRDLGYVFWVLFEQVAFLALPRLLLFPLAAYIIGKEGFGVFATALSVTLILGYQPQNGLGTGLLRHLSDYPEDKREEFFGTAVRLCRPAMMIIIVIGLIGIFIAGMTKLASWRLLNCLIPLLISLYPENLSMLLLTEKRYLRLFHHQAMWTSFRSVAAIILGIVGAIIWDEIGLAWGYMIGTMAVYALLRFRCNYQCQKTYNKEMAAILKSAWLQITIAGILIVSCPYINRLLLSFYHSYEEVADLVAASSIAFMFLGPVMCFGGLILSIVSKYTSIKQLSLKGKMYCIVMLLCGMIVVPAILYFCGPLIIKTLYPNFGQECIELLDILIWMVPAVSLSFIARPLVCKFGSIITIPIVNAATFVATFIFAFLLIPDHKASGAAWAIVITNFITGLLWSAACIRLFLKKS